MRLVRNWQPKKVSGLLDAWVVMLIHLDLRMIPEVMKVLEELVIVVVMILELPLLSLMSYLDPLLLTGW